MIHSVYTMTIGRYGQLEKSKDASLLKLWYNPFPVQLFKKRIEKFFQEVTDLWGADGIGSELSDQIERAYMVNKMLQMSILYDALYTLMVVKAGIDITLLMLNRDPKEPANLEYFKEQCKELTGIEIKGLDDILKLKDEMTRMSDKFKERFPDEVETDEKPSFVKGAMSIFSLMEQDYDSEMTLYELSELKKLADERRKQLEKQLNKYGPTG